MSIKSLTPDRGTDSTQPDSAQTSTWRTLPALAAALLCFSGSQAVFAADDKEADANKAIEEVAVTLPAAPLTENLLPFYDSQSMRFFIDTASLTVNPDSSVRYTLVSVSQSGARNVSYEAILCSQGEKRLYAFGRPDGSWSRSRIDTWDRISSLGANNQHSILAREFLCDGNTAAGKASQILAKLKRR